ncbi:MAG: response regulator transcription factor [Chloroflexi bacterium]|nr:response regulator transcription factor [Chloroflexota bacterium]
METTKTIRVFIAAKPGIMRNSLLSYLRAITNLQIVGLADQVDSALQCMREHKPQLVIIDSDLSEDRVIGLVEQINAEPPAPQIIVLVDSLRQREHCLKAGAQHALLKGFLDKQLELAVRFGEKK